MMPARSLASGPAPKLLCLSGEKVEGSIDVQGGTHSGLTPARLSRTSAMWPPSSRTVTRKKSFSRWTARRPLKMALVKIAIPAKSEAAREGSSARCCGARF